MSKINELARELARQAHGDTLNQHDGTHYFDTHVTLVAEQSANRAYKNHLHREVAEAVGWLHDTVEDTDLTLYEIRYTLLSSDALYTERSKEQDVLWGVDTVVNAVDALTKRAGETLEQYYDRVIAARHYAMNTKMVDVQANFRLNHLITDEAKQARLARKYSYGTYRLGFI